MNKPVPALFFGLLLLVSIIAPSMAMALIGASSMAAGALLVALVYLFMFVALSGHAWPGKSVAPALVIALCGSVFLYVHAAYSFFSSDRFDAARFWQSHLFLLVFFLGAFCFVRLAERLAPREADRAVKFVFWVFLAAAVASLFRFSPFFPPAAHKSVVFYGEPSHFSLDFLPLLLFMVVRSDKRVKLGLLAAGFGLALMLENLTMLVGFAVIFCITVRMRFWLPIIPVVALVLSLMDLTYYANRLNFAGGDNLSTLVYLQGLERAQLNLLETGGLGVGFQQFGIVGSLGDVAVDIVAIFGQEMNMLDGGSAGQKFVGEFGVLGLLCIVLYCVYLVRSVRWLSRISAAGSTAHDAKAIFFHCCFAMFVIDIFVRGTGYFSSSGLFFVASLCWLFVKPIRVARAASHGRAPLALEA